MVLIFIFIYFEWRDTENQQYEEAIFKINLLQGEPLFQSLETIAALVKCNCNLLIKLNPVLFKTFIIKAINEGLVKRSLIFTLWLHDR